MMFEQAKGGEGAKSVFLAAASKSYCADEFDEDKIPEMMRPLYKFISPVKPRVSIRLTQRTAMKIC
jgi:hypothetical protein